MTDFTGKLFEPDKSGKESAFMFDSVNRSNPLKLKSGKAEKKANNGKQMQY